MRTNAILLCARVKPGCSVDTITIQKSHRWHIQFDCSLNQPFRLRCSFQKAERTRSMQLDILISHRVQSPATRFVENLELYSNKAQPRYAISQLHPTVPYSKTAHSTIRLSRPMVHMHAPHRSAAHEK